MGLMGTLHKRNKKCLKAIQHYEIKMPIYIDNSIFLLSAFNLSLRQETHKYFIVDWIRLEASLWRHQHSWVKIVFSFLFARPPSPAAATAIMISNWKRFDLRATKSCSSLFTPWKLRWGDEKWSTKAFMTLFELLKTVAAFAIFYKIYKLR